MKKCIGIMQPYFFPYLGYFQYIAATDAFVFYDDVQFIMRGWINRNNILINNRKHLFTVPLRKPSPNRAINQTMLSKDHTWVDKLLKTLQVAYKQAPFFSETMVIIDSVLSNPGEAISDLAVSSVKAVCYSVGLMATFVDSSANYGNGELSGIDRILDICRLEGADRCIVPVRGAELYPREIFLQQRISLSYLKPVLREYRQGGVDRFIPSLSIIDVLMWNGMEATAKMIKENELL